MERAVTDGSVVLDIGTGTGIFAMLACRYGARKVYAIDPNGAIEVAREIARDNGFDDRIEFSPRLAKVPILWQGDWPDGSKLVSFKAFRYIYLQGLYGGCTGSGGCKLVVQPGLTGEKLVTDDDPLLITSIGIPDVHISQEVRDRFGELRVTSYSLIR